MNEFEICYMDENEERRVVLFGKNKQEVKKAFEALNPTVKTIKNIIDKSDYKVLRLMRSIIGIIGLLATVLGVGMTIWFLKDGGMATLGIPSAISVALIGLFLLLASEVAGVFMDNTTYSKEMLQLMRESSK